MYPKQGIVSAIHMLPYRQIVFVGYAQLVTVVDVAVLVQQDTPLPLVRRGAAVLAHDVDDVVVGEFVADDPQKGIPGVDGFGCLGEHRQVLVESVVRQLGLGLVPDLGWKVSLSGRIRYVTYTCC